MIHIDYPNGQRPPEEWLVKARDLTRKLKAAPDKAERHRIIDDNSHLWGEIRDWLQAFSSGKCWFSEARDTFSYWQVEHFRPKKEAKEPSRDGYWWLAFDHLNYRLCGGVGNAKKGSYFPLKPGSAPATCPEDNCDDEFRILIDPIRKSDVDLITFSHGRAEPSEPDGWNRKRAEVSILRYKLNDHEPLLRARTRIWNQCQRYVDQLEVLIVEHKEASEAGRQSQTRNEKIEAAKVSLQNLTRPTEPFSAVARAFVLRDSRSWVRSCVA